MTRKRDNRRSVMFDVKYPSHPKIRGLNVNAKWLNLVGVMLAGDNMSDGVIDPQVACSLAGVPAKTASDLTRRGLWHKQGHKCPDCEQPEYAEDVVIHHYLLHQTSAEKLQRIMSERSEIGRRANHKRHGHEGEFEECWICQS